MTAEQSLAFDLQKNRKALIYTVLICGLLIVLFFIIRWKNEQIPEPVIQDLIEINLGNNDEGFGEIQPLVKGARNIQPSEPEPAPQKSAAASAYTEDQAEPDPNAAPDAAPVMKPVKKPAAKTPATIQPAVKPEPAPRKPRLTYQGPGNENGNNKDEDNGYRYQGNQPNGRGDAGVPDGNKDSYGDTRGGSTGGPRVVKGNRRITGSYAFTGDLNKATIYALVKVSPSGQGSFIGFDKGSTSRSAAYANAIREYLRSMKFNTAAEESLVTVVFNFNVR